MTTPLWILLLFVGWTLLLVSLLGGQRIYWVLSGQKKPNRVSPEKPDGADLHWRICRAHLNALENLPMVATVIVVAHLVGVSSSSFDVAAEVLMVARVLQSIFHISSNRNLIINFRFTAFAIQLGCVVWMLVEIVRFSPSP